MKNYLNFSKAPFKPIRLDFILMKSSSVKILLDLRKMKQDAAELMPALPAIRRRIVVWN
ncbi:MAG: hypothetical protein LBL74_01990 [Bacteroidales bacterium]|jgi:hypothetical protein|nr:hypothetical protein [Bacteroidales bacterium]